MNTKTFNKTIHPVSCRVWLKSLALVKPCQAWFCYCQNEIKVSAHPHSAYGNALTERHRKREREINSWNTEIIQQWKRPFQLKPFRLYHPLNCSHVQKLPWFTVNVSWIKVNKVKFDIHVLPLNSSHFSPVLIVVELPRNSILAENGQLLLLHLL